MDPDNNPFEYQTADQLIRTRQTNLLRGLLRTVGLLTSVAIVLILFLPGFATGGDVLEPFLRNLVIVIFIGGLLFALEQGWSDTVFVLVIAFALAISPYSAYMEAPGNVLMLGVMMVPIGLGGFVTGRRHFWMIYALTVVLTILTFLALLHIKGVPLEYRSLVTLLLLITLFALMVDALGSSYRDSVRLTFNQLQQLRATRNRLSSVSADLDQALTDRDEAQIVSEERALTERLALEATNAGVIRVNLGDMTVQLSPDFVRHARLADPINTFNDLLDQLQDESRRRLQDGMDQLLSGHTARVTGDFRFDLEDRDLTWFLAADLVRDSSRARAYLHGIVIDATERVVAQDERQALSEQLTERQRLESLGVLAGGVAHDFNNLLHVMMLNADLARESATGASREAIDKLLQSAGHAAELCAQLLAYSGQGRATVESINLTALVNEMANLLEVSIPATAQLTYRDDGNRPVIEGDATQVRQVVMNLITNAADALEGSSGTISLNLHNVQHDGDHSGFVDVLEPLPAGEYAAITVTDTGNGMSPDVKDNIFEPFFTTRRTGRGLGLSAVLGIVKAHGGGIRIQSTPGAGTTIEVLLPVSGAAMPATEPERTPVAAIGTGKVLFADDEAEIRNLARIVLTDCGFEVIEATDGIEAERQFNACRDELCLIILDVMMPGKTGTEVYRAIHEQATGIPVILSSGFSREDAMQQVEGLGEVQFLKKPYLTRTLREMALAAVATQPDQAH